MQSLKWRIGSKIRLKWTVPWFSVFVDQTNLKIIWKFSLSQYRCHKTPIDVENCVKSALNSNHRKQNFMVITNWGGGDYQLRSALAAKQIWVAVITIWGTLDSFPPPVALSNGDRWKPWVSKIKLNSYNTGKVIRMGEICWININVSIWSIFCYNKTGNVRLS